MQCDDLLKGWAAIAQEVKGEEQQVRLVKVQASLKNGGAELIKRYVIERIYLKNTRGE